MNAVNLIATIPAFEHTSTQVRHLLEDYATHCLAMEGTERFEVYSDRDRPSRIVVVERYRDDAAFRLHLADPANAVLNDELSRLTDGGSTLQFLA